MRHFRIWIPLAAWFLALAFPASAQEPILLSADVSAVVTGGSWSSGSLTGTYRVVVRTGGGEHVVSYAQIDWIAEPGSYGEEPRVVQSKLANTGSWRLDRPRFLKSGKLWRVEL